MKIARLYMIIGALLIIYGFYSTNSIYVTTHDNYSVNDSSNLYFYLGIIFNLFGVIEVLFSRVNKPLNNKLSYTHLVLSSVTVIVVAYFMSVTNNSYSGSINTIISLIIIAGLLGQLLLLINIIYTLAGKNKNTP